MLYTWMNEWWRERKTLSMLGVAEPDYVEDALQEAIDADRIERGTTAAKGPADRRAEVMAFVAQAAGAG